ncbi:hypothetical protein E1200_07680 [Actinomadura sp. GC306]|uniref:hypothetical protein n=1 Tax=Actinomadura sp. GC306 TaxID=2530367 RepID=UPI00105045D5|nr:hypothetical protein [Actinomadura sp. GC306]TDC69721.1 hypothetical protein E1200_07680 [Actinomadura sp. GC306]
MSAKEASQLSLEFQLDLAPGTQPGDVHAHGERVMQELLHLEACNEDFTDSAVATNAETNTITVELLILNTADPTTALHRALALIRTAAHAVGAATPHWPTVSEMPVQVQFEKAREVASA